MEWCKAYFAVLNRLGVTRESDRRSDRLSLSKMLSLTTLRGQNAGPVVVSRAQAIEEPFITTIKHALVDSYSPTVDLMYRKSVKFILTR